MNQSEIQSMQRRISDAGFPLVADGFWGPKSQSACKAYLKSLMPSPNPWPYSDQSSLRKFYGEPGNEDNLVLINLPYPLFYGDKKVTKTRCHKKVAESLIRILKEIGDKYGDKPGIMEEVLDYGGVFNFRLKRGGSSYSVHAWGAAIDLDADDNSFRDNWPMKSDMPLEIMECFAREGWTSAGAAWGFDSMHFEATKQR
jgi:hypothetical protein